MDEMSRLTEAFAAYKEHVYAKLLELLPQRLGRLGDGS